MEIELYKTQFDFVNCNDRFTAMLGGVGSGKTLAGSVKSIRYALPKTLGLVVAPTYRMLQDATIRTYRKINEELIASYNKTDSNIVLKNGAEILFRSSDDPDKLRGPNINWAWMDEAGLSKKGTWEIVIGRLRADGQAGPCWVTTTPKGKNWLYDMHKQMTVFKSATTQNPYLSKEFVKSLLDSYTGEFLRQEVYGEFARFEGLVYPDFNEDVHVKKRDPKGFIYWGLAIDEGYTNPAVILLIGVDSDGRKHIHQEFYERGKLQSDVVAMAQEMAAGKNVTEIAVDASAAGLIADLRNVSLPAVPQKGRVLDGIHVVQEHLKIQGDGKPYLTVDPSCVNTINEFESYVWKPGKDEPVKEMDHCFTSETLILTKNGYKPISKIIAGEYVWSPLGWNKVYRSTCSGVKKVVDYGVFRCTPDHKILTSRGLIEVDSLRYDDKIMVWTNQREYTLMEFLIAATRTRIIEMPRFILGAVLTKVKMAKRDICIETFGNTIMAKFLTGLWYIILTAILGIMASIIWSLSALMNMPKNIIGEFGKVQKNISLKSDRLRKSGMDQKMGEYGTATTQKNNGKIKNYIKNNAWFVEKNILLPTLVEANTVIKIAKRLHCAEEEKVYNLSTKIGMYFANGILVSNSMDALRYYLAGNLPDDEKIVTYDERVNISPF